MDWNAIRGVILDMDGVLWRDQEPMTDLKPFMAFLRQRRLPFVLATNNSSKHPAEYVQKLARMGVHDIAETQIITSATATADYLRTKYAAATPLYVIGMNGLRRALQEAGYILAHEHVQVVVVGVDFELTYEKVKRAALHIRAGATFIGTNHDLTFPTPEGLVPGAGSLLAMLEAATDVKPLVIGKPATAMFEVALQRLGSRADQTLMIGDRLETDILGAAQMGIQSALVLTGVTRREHLAESAIQPDGVYATLSELLGSSRG